MCLQLVPFPFDLVQRELRRYPNAEFLWCQEEPMNMGAYTHICPRLETCMRNEDREVCCSRPHSKTAACFENRKEHKRKAKKRKEQKKQRKDYTFQRLFNEKPNIISGCPGRMLLLHLGLRPHLLTLFSWTCCAL